MGVPNGNTLLVTNPGGTTSGVGFGVVTTPAVGHPNRNGRVGPSVSLAGVNMPVNGQSTDPENLIRVRLAGVAAPLAGQPFFSASRDHLAAMANGKQVRVIKVGVDPDGATVAQVFVASGASVNYRQVRDGMAFQSFNDGCASALHAALESAMTSRTGIWQANRPVAPWLSALHTQ
jgi:endonuclease YncB( thermonuclease family)